jgi:hypothetical protein
MIPLEDCHKKWFGEVDAAGLAMTNVDLLQSLDMDIRRFGRSRIGISTTTYWEEAREADLRALPAASEIHKGIMDL